MHIASLCLLELNLTGDSGYAYARFCDTHALTNSSFSILQAPPTHEQFWPECSKFLASLFNAQETISIVKLLLDLLLRNILAYTHVQVVWACVRLTK